MKNILLLLVLGFIATAEAQPYRWLGGNTVFGEEARPDPAAIFQVESTTQGWLPPRMTTAQRDNLVVIHGSLPVGLMIFNTDEGTAEAWAGATWTVIAGGPSPGTLLTWGPSNLYRVDDFIWEPGTNQLYICLVEHTSSADFLTDVANWKKLIFLNEDDFVVVGELTVEGQATFEGPVTMDSTGALKLPVGDVSERPSPPAQGMIRYNSEDDTFEGYNGSEWGSIGGGLSLWQASKPYLVDDIVLLEATGTIYKANTAHTSTATFNDDIANWDEVSNPFLNTNLNITGNSLISTNTNGDINLNPNGFGGVVIDGLRVDNYVLSSTGLNQAIELNPNGTGTVDVPYLSSGGVVFGGSNGALIEDIANFSYASIDERLSVNNATIGNIGVSANTISSTNANGNIILNPNGTGDVLVDTLTNRRVVFNDNKALTDDSQFTYDSATKKLRVDGLDLGGVNTITTHSGNNDLILTAHGSGEIELQKPTLIDDLKVTGQAVVGQVVNGDIDITANGIGEINLNNAVNIGDLQIDNDAITNTVLNGNIALVPNGTGDATVVYGTNELNLDPQLQKASIISNGSFERGVAGVTCTNATASSENTIVVNAENNNRSLKIVTDGSVDWSCDIPLKSGMVGGEQFFYSLFSSTSLQTVEICQYNGTIERNCQELTGISEWYEFYSGLNQAFATTNSLRIKGADSEATGTIYVDLVDAQLGMPKIGPSKNCAGGLDCENVFSARIDGTTISDENISGWLSSCSGTTLKTCLFASGLFTQPPNCSSIVIRPTSGLGIATEDSATASQVVIRRGNDAGTLADYSFRLICQKAAPDFKPITEQGVVVTGQADGALLVVTNESVTSNVTIGNATITVPFANVKESNLISWASNEATFQASGRYSLSANVSTVNTSDAATLKYTLEIDSGSGYVATDYQISSFMSTGQRMTPNIEFVFDANKGSKARLRVGSNSGGSIISQSAALTSSMTIRSVLDRQSIVGDLQGMVKVEGVTSRIETGFGLFGGATESDVCSSTPCTRHDQLGSIGFNMSATRSATGQYEFTAGGFKPNSLVSCTVIQSTNSTTTHAGFSQNQALRANGSGDYIRGLRITTMGSNTAADSRFLIQCTGEVP
jgi:hypothetical protein